MKIAAPLCRNCLYFASFLARPRSVAAPGLRQALGRPWAALRPAAGPNRGPPAPSTKGGDRILRFGQSAFSGATENARGRPNPSEIVRGRPPSSPEMAVDEIMHQSVSVWPAIFWGASGKRPRPPEPVGNRPRPSAELARNRRRRNNGPER